MNCAGIVTFIHPPNAHINEDSIVKRGPVIPRTVGFVGIHGPAGVGMHVPGVKTPRAAAVCAAVIGFNKLVHIPNGITLTKGAKLVQVAIGPDVHIIVEGNAIKDPGANPKGHIVNAPVQTPHPILNLSVS